MRYVFNYEELAKLNSTIGTIAEADSATVLELGKRDMGEKIQVVVRLTTSEEEIKYATFCGKPDGYTGEAEVICIKSKVLSGIISSLASFKEDISIEVNGGEVKIGNSTTSVPVETLSALPQEMNSGSQDPVLMHFQVNGRDLNAFIKRALESTDPDEMTHGLSNAMVCVDSVTGKVKGTSFDGYTLSYGTMQARMATIPNGIPEEIKKQMEAGYAQMKKDLDAFCSETGQKPEGVTLLFPTVAIRHLKSLITDNSNGDKEQVDDVFTVGVDRRRVYFYYNNQRTMYTFVQGRNCAASFDIIENAVAAEVTASVQLDQASLLRSVEFLNGTGDLMEKIKLKPIRIEFGKGCLNLSAGKGFSIKNMVKANAVVGEGTQVAVSGKFLKEKLSAFEKGGICATVVAGGLILSNGTLDNQSEYKSVIALFDDSAVEKEEDDADTSSETETSVEVDESVA